MNSVRILLLFLVLCEMIPLCLLNRRAASSLNKGIGLSRMTWVHVYEKTLVRY
jgi:hypothetical protein